MLEEALVVRPLTLHSDSAFIRIMKSFHDEMAIPSWRFATWASNSLRCGTFTGPALFAKARFIQHRSHL